MEGPTTYQAIFLLLLLIWSTVWKGIALWKAGRRDQKVWFVAILIINTVGVFEIIYLLLNRKKKELSSTKNR